MVKFLNGEAPPPEPAPAWTGPIMTLREYAALARAPRRPSTRMTMRSYDIGPVPGPWEHMYVEFDDGRERYIARGGPARAPLHPSFPGGWPASVTGRVDPAEKSPDFNRGGRIMAQDVLPDRSAREASLAAERHAAGVRRGGNRYHPGSNSNSFAADVYEAETGRRVGDSLTPGYRTRLTRDPPPPEPWLFKRVMNPRLF